MNFLQPLQPLPLLVDVPQSPSTGDTTTPDFFDKMWIGIANMTGNPTPSGGLPTPTATQPTVSAPATGGTLGNIKTGIDAAIGAAASAATGGAISPTIGLDVGKHGLVDVLFTSRMIYLLVGLMLIGAGLYSFKATQTVIQTGTKVAKTAAKLAA